MKEKLTVEQQIQHMKSKGVQFNIVSEEEAISYLTNNTYYFKIKAYAKNYDKYRTTEKAGQYVNLEFAYLKDLAIIELLSLKDFLMLYQRFYMEYPNARTSHDLYYPMQGVRKLRNAAAHSNCLINTLKRPYSGQVRYNSKVDAFVKKIGSIDKKSRSSNMSNQVVYDFVTMLYLVDEITESMGMKEQTIKELYDLVHGRMVKHADYYKKESAICSTYNFIKKIVDFLYEKTYTNKVI